MPNVANVSVGVNLDLSKTGGQLRAFTSKKYALRLDDKFSGSLGAITASTKNFDQSLAKATNRVVAFGAAAAVFNGARRAFQAFAKDTIDVEDSLTKINVNLGESADGLKKFSADLFNVARQTGQSFETASKAAEEFARQGLSAEETIKRTKDALVLSRIAAIDSTEAVNDLTAAVNSYAKEALTTTDIINKFVALDTQFAVNSKDLADSLQRAGAVAAESGLSLDKFLAIVTAIKQETGRSGAIIGNSLKTIFERAKSPETLKDFEELGIATKDLEGNLLPVDRILNNLASSFDHLSQAQQKQVAKSIANIQQINVFKVLLKDLSSSYSVTARAAEVSGNAQDQAIQKNLALNKTLKSAINSTELTITEFFATLGNESIGPLFKGVLDQFESFRKSIAADDETGKTIGQSIVKGIANVLTGPGLGIVAFALFRAFGKVASTIGGEFQSLLGLNTVSRQRVTIQETINGLLSQANKAELEAFNIAGSTLQRQEALLAIKTRIASIDESSALVNSFLGPGVLGAGSSINKKLSGKVGNFVDPLQSAIAREVAAGVPKSLIYIDRDPRLVGPNNPQGLLVANRRDEPAGGFQGVNRVIAQGGDPKSAGTIRIPHFAISSNEALSLGAAAVRPGGVEGFVKGLDISGVNFDVSIKKVRKQILDTIEKSLQIDISALGPVPKRAFSKLATEVLTVRQQDIAAIQATQVAGRNAGVRAIERQNGLSAYNAPIGPTLPPGRVSNVVPSKLNIISAQTTKASAEQLAAYEVERATLAARPSQTSFGPSGLLPRRSTPTNLSEKLGSISFLGGFLGSEEKDVKKLRGLGVNTNTRRVEELLQSRNLDRQSRRQNAGLVAAIALPAAAGFLSEGKGGTLKGILGSAATVASQTGSIGLLSGNPVVAGITAGAGALVGVFLKLKKSAEEVSAEFDKQEADRRNENEAVARTIQLQGQLNDALKEGADASVIQKIGAQIRESRSAVTSEGGRRVLGLSGKSQDAAQLDLLDQTARDTAQNNIQRALAGGRDINNLSSGKKNELSDNEAFANDIKGALTDDVVNKISDAQILSFQKLATKNFDVRPQVVGSGQGDILVTNQEEVNTSIKDFNDALKEVTPVLQQIGIQKNQVKGKDLQGILIGLTRGVVARRADIAGSGQLGKDIQEARGRLPTGAFLSPANLEAVRRSAFVGRTPTAGQGERSQAGFDFYKAIEETGAVDKLAFTETSDFKKSKAGVQAKNVGDLITEFLAGKGVSAGGLRNNRGDINLGAATSRIGQYARSGASDAERAAILEKIGNQALTTRKASGLQGIKTDFNYTPGIRDVLGVGVDYGAFTKGLKPGGDGYINKDNLSANVGVRTRNGTYGNYGRPFITNDTLAGALPADARKYDLTQQKKDQKTEQQEAREKDKKDFAEYSKLVTDAVNAASKTAEALANTTLKLSVDIQGHIDAAQSDEVKAQLQDLAKTIQDVSNTLQAGMKKPNPPGTVRVY